MDYDVSWGLMGTHNVREDSLVDSHEFADVRGDSDVGGDPDVWWTLK